MKVTLHEVAARADVSIATASRALNGLPVSQATLARVRQAADELGYVANEAARTLRSERTQTMGLLFSDLRNTLGLDLLDALSETIEDAGYSLLISTARGDGPRYDLLMRRFLERRVDALFCIMPPEAGDSLARYRAAKIPVMVLFGGAAAFGDLPTVRPAVTEASKALAERLHGLGHRRVTLVRRDSRPGPGTAAADALRAQGLQVEILEAGEGVGTSEVIARLRALTPRVTAVVASDPLVRGLLAGLSAAGMQVPGDLSVVSLNELAAEPHHRKHGVSAVTIDPHRMGRAAGEAMLAWLGGTRPPDRALIQTGIFHPRGTTGSAPD